LIDPDRAPSQRWLTFKPEACEMTEIISGLYSRGPPDIEPPRVIAENRPTRQSPSQKKGYFTMADPKDVDVTPQKPLYITDENRTFNTVTIYPGGQIWVQTVADIRIQTLVKK
jgi:hypothetical protein